MDSQCFIYLFGHHVRLCIYIVPRQRCARWHLGYPTAAVYWYPSVSWLFFVGTYVTLLLCVVASVCELAIFVGNFFLPYSYCVVVSVGLFSLALVSTLPCRGLRARVYRWLARCTDLAHLRHCWLYSITSALCPIQLSCIVNDLRRCTAIIPYHTASLSLYAQPSERKKVL